MTIRVNSPAAWRGRLVKVADIRGTETDICWIGRDGEIEVRTVYSGDLVSFEEAMSPQSSWGASVEAESKIRSWRSE